MYMWEVAAFSLWGSCHLGNFHLGKCTFGKLPLGKLHIWENTLRKLPLGKRPLGKYLTSFKLRLHSTVPSVSFLWVTL